MQSGYRLIQAKGESIVWIPDLIGTKSRLRACRTLAKRLGSALSILDSEVVNEYVVTKKDRQIARLVTLPHWS